VDTPTLIWIIIGIIVVAIIIVVAVMLSRRTSAKRLEAQQAKAQDIREDARRTEMAAREREAQAAQARAEAATAAAEAEQAKARAAQASINAERAAATIDDHQSDAAKLREEQAEKLRKADELDPTVTTTADGRQVRDDRTADGHAPASAAGGTDGYTPAPGARTTDGYTPAPGAGADTAEDRRIVRDHPGDATPTDRDGDGIRDDREATRTADGTARTDPRPASDDRV
jgi:FtsZ-interacting cell division protein ZipA